LGRIFVSPNYHRIHHQLNGPQDVNLGFALTIWDQLAHRAIFPRPDTIRIDTGLPGRPLAVEQSSDRPRHLAVLFAQLMGPFRPLDSARATSSGRRDAPTASARHNLAVSPPSRTSHGASNP
jgi:hypothetical protein